MTTETETETTTVRVTVRYHLTQAAQRALVLRGTKAAISQTIQVELPLSEALALGAARIDDDGEVRDILVDVVEPRARAKEDGSIEIEMSGYGVSHVELDHILNDAEALALLRAGEERTARARAKVEQKAAVNLAAWQARRAEIAEAVERLRAGTAQIADATEWNPTLKGDDGWEVSLKYGEVDPDVWLSLLNPLIKAYRDEQEAAAAAVVAAAAAARGAWIAAHGSERLRKCLSLGLADECQGLYREERLALEAPGYVWDPPGGRAYEDSAVRNPTMAALAELERQRVRFPGAELLKIRPPSDEEDNEWTTRTPWAEAIKVAAFEWAPHKIAYLLVQS